MRNRRGFLLSELLAALLIISLLLPVSILAIRVSIGSLDFNEEVQDEIASIQLRRILSMSYEVRVENGSISFEYLGRSMRIVYGNYHVYMTPGTYIFYSDIDSAWFCEEEGLVYACIERNEEISRIALVPSS